MVSKSVDIVSQLFTNLFLFFLVMGMASTVDIRDIKNQLKNKKAIGLGLFCQVRRTAAEDFATCLTLTSSPCQFGLLPFIGWVVVELFKFPYAAGITLIIVVSSPGVSLLFFARLERLRLTHN